MKLIFVKPAPGLRLRAPDGTPIPEAGMALPQDTYLLRRLAEGDLVEASELPGDPASAEAEPATARRRERS